MKQALQLKIGQHLTMTPQLQQAIRLLQLSTLDLQQEIQEALDSNPMLEVGEEEAAENTEAKTELDADAPAKQETTETVSAEPEETHVADSDWNEDIPDELSTDSQWEDTFQTATPASTSNNDFSDSNFEANDTAVETLQDHLNWQLNLTPMSELDQLIATNIIDGITPDGYLSVELEAIHEHFTSQDDPHLQETELDEIEAVLRRVQQFDPPGWLPVT